MEPGEKVSISFVRKGSKMTKEAELVEPPEDYRKKRMVHIWHGDDDPHGMKIKKKILGLEGLEALKDLEIEIPEIEIEVHEDMEELREELDELREELEELKEELEKSD
jgi:vacuolar-type H+-ATPase subunit I/STV1